MDSEIYTLIEAAYIKKFECPDQSIDDNRITPTILTAERLYIRPLLGRRLYIEIGNQVVAGSLTTANEILLNQYIAPCLAKYVVMDLRPALTYQLTNKGSQEKSSDYSQPSELKTIQYMMDNDRMAAAVFANTLQEFLRENNSSYPLYTPNKPVRAGIYTGYALSTGGYVNGRRVWPRINTFRGNGGI